MQTIRRWRLSSSEFRTEGLSYYVVCAWPRNAYFVSGRPESHNKPASVSCDAGPVEMRSMPWLFLSSACPGSVFARSAELDVGALTVILSVLKSTNRVFTWSSLEGKHARRAWATPTCKLIRGSTSSDCVTVSHGVMRATSATCTYFRLMIRAASIQNTWGAALIDGHAVNSGGDFKTKGVGFCKAQSGCEIACEARANGGERAFFGFRAVLGVSGRNGGR